MTEEPNRNEAWLLLQAAREDNGFVSGSGPMGDMRKKEEEKRERRRRAAKNLYTADLPGSCQPKVEFLHTDPVSCVCNSVEQAYTSLREALDSAIVREEAPAKELNAIVGITIQAVTLPRLLVEGSPSLGWTTELAFFVKGFPARIS